MKCIYGHRQTELCISNNGRLPNSLYIHVWNFYPQNALKLH